jgi:hypothetical protein
VATLFVSLRDIDVIDVLPQQHSFNAKHFINNLLLPLGAKFSDLAGDIGRKNLLIHCDNSQCSQAKVSSALRRNTKGNAFRIGRILAISLCAMFTALGD